MASSLPDLLTATFAELQNGLSKQLYTSVDLVKAYQARIAEVNDRLHAVIAINPKALEEAASFDEERKQGKVRGPLHGLPIGVKDNIDVEGMDTTAGSYALKGAVNAGDAECIRLLRAAGGIVLAKLNLSIWANYRHFEPGAWSAVGGQCTSPYYPQGNPSGSSSGSGVAMAVGLAAGCLGSETAGSIMAPSSNCALAGIRPQPGVVSGKGVVPITSVNDTVGPMCNTVQDSALLLDAITSKGVKYADHLKENALSGVKLGVPRNLWNWHEGFWSEYISPDMEPAFEDAIKRMRQLGAIVEEVEIEPDHLKALEEHTERLWLCMRVEFNKEIAEYLATLKHVPSGVKTLADIIEFSQNNEQETPPSYQNLENFIQARDSGAMTDKIYIEARERVDSCKGILDYEMKKHGSLAFVFPGLRWDPWALAAYPLITVPLSHLPEDTPVSNAKAPEKDTFAIKTYDQHPNKPFGINFAAGPGSEGTLIALAYAFQQATLSRPRPVPYPEATPRTQLADVVSKGK